MHKSKQFRNIIITGFIIVIMAMSNIINAQTSIYGTTVWSVNKVVTGDITVCSGAQFTILATVDMPKNSKIIVKPGGRLIIGKGGEVLATDFPWSGIEVWGDNTKPQTYLSTGMPAFQGELIVKDNGIIRSAVCGIKTIKAINLYMNDWTKTGGIVKLNEANIIDCGTGLWMGPYHNYNSSLSIILPNRSYIKNSNFIMQGLAPGNYNTYFTFIELYAIDKINILGNNFTNNRPTYAPYRGKGIISYSSTINVDHLCTSSSMTPCTTYKKNVFHYLKNGITSYQSSNSKNIKVKNSIFTECYRGIYTSNGNSDIITNNIIELTEIDFQMGEDFYREGIYIDGGSGFIIQENEITNNNDPAYSFGIAVNNTGAVNNEIYLNTISKMNVGITAYHQNKEIYEEGGIGLKLICNYFDNPMYDHWVVGQFGDKSKTWIGISYTQGVSTLILTEEFLPAAEHFSSINHSYEYDYWNRDANAIYYLYDENANYEALPTNYSNNVTPDGIQIPNT